MHRTFSPDLMERSYYLPNDQGFNESVQRTRAMRETCERIEQIDELIDSNNWTEDMVFCKICVSDLHRKTNAILNELRTDSLAYKDTIKTLNISTSSSGVLNTLQDEITLLENTLFALKEEGKSFSEISTNIQTDLHQTTRDYDTTLRDIGRYDYQLDNIDISMLSVLRQLDTASREINHLRRVEVPLSTLSTTNASNSAESLTSMNSDMHNTQQTTTQHNKPQHITTQQQREHNKPQQLHNTSQYSPNNSALAIQSA